MSNKSNKTWQPDKRIAFRTVGDETIIIGISGGEVHLLNDTASFLWNLLAKEPQSPDKLARALTAAYDVDEAEAQNDISEFLANLKAKKLITEPRGA